MSTHCRNGHRIESAKDRLRNGYCRECQRDDNRKYRLKQAAALALVRSLEARGIHVDIDRMALGTDPTATPEAVAERLVSVFGPGVD
ncbi:hypothetical protein LCL87_14935 [Rhodococcus hoagii]|nr:hypothetical protein [Prescottella equi]